MKVKVEPFIPIIKGKLSTPGIEPQTLATQTNALPLNYTDHIHIDIILALVGISIYKELIFTVEISHLKINKNFKCVEKVII